MKTSLRLAALVGIIGLTSWLSFGARANALESCSSIVGRFCTFPDFEIACTPDAVYLEGVCVCGSNHHFYCY